MSYYIAEYVFEWCGMYIKKMSASLAPGGFRSHDLSLMRR